jgi:hypothetical protein
VSSMDLKARGICARRIETMTEKKFETQIKKKVAAVSGMMCRYDVRRGYGGVAPTRTWLPRCFGY